MSKLSALLNPAPASASATSPTMNHAPQVQPLVLDGHHRRNSSFSYSGSPTYTRHPSITSPGLEALANAASNIAPMPSPTQHTGSFAHSIPFQPNYSQFGSRPSSSHTALPPLSNDYNHAHIHHNSSHSTSLEQYHHHSRGERRQSDATNSSAQLPPLQQSPTNQHFTVSSDVGQPLNGITDYANGNLSKQTNHIMPNSQQNTGQIEADRPSDAQVTSQIRQPSPGPPQSLPTADFPESQSEQVEVKAETVENPSAIPTLERRPDGQAPEALMTSTKFMGSPIHKNVVDVKMNGLSPQSSENPVDAPSTKPKAPPSRKRAAPKKGTANAIRPAAKKRKLDGESADGPLSGQRSATPATSRASNTPAPKNRKQGSITPARSSSVINGPEDEDGSEEDTEAYCICRQPDDHTLMIGCDGPCEDWFHVRCVSMDSVKAKLISKWYCPNCADKGLETLWKRMCRLEGCQEPARQDGENKSKYCCDEHGAEFMKIRAFDPHSVNRGITRPVNNKRRRRDNFTDNYGNGADSGDEEPGHLRGGVLKVSELKAIADGVKDINTFRRLGDGVLSPPPTVSPEGEDVKMENGSDPKSGVTFTPHEIEQLEEVALKRNTVREQKKMLDDRDRFLLLVTARAKTVLGELKEQDKSVTVICGYDTRLSWSDYEFNEWRASPEGKSALEKGGVLSVPTTKENRETMEGMEGNENVAPESLANGEDEEETGKGVCKKKRCERHKAWLKLMQQEILFEIHQARQAMKKLEAEEKAIRDRAMIRHLEEEGT